VPTHSDHEAQARRRRSCLPTSKIAPEGEDAAHLESGAGQAGIPDEHRSLTATTRPRCRWKYLETLKGKRDGKLICHAISPTPGRRRQDDYHGGLGDALNHIGKRAAICCASPRWPGIRDEGWRRRRRLRAGGPMEDINLHFPGTSAPSRLQTILLAAMIDNHIHTATSSVRPAPHRLEACGGHERRGVA